MKLNVAVDMFDADKYQDKIVKDQRAMPEADIKIMDALVKLNLHEFFKKHFLSEYANLRGFTFNINYISIFKDIRIHWERNNCSTLYQYEIYIRHVNKDDFFAFQFNGDISNNRNAISLLDYNLKLYSRDTNVNFRGNYQTLGLSHYDLKTNVEIMKDFKRVYIDQY